MLLYPRLPAPTARLLIEEMADVGLDELRHGSSTRHPGCTYSPTGGNRVDERGIVELRDTLRTIADECGYPRSVGPGERVRFDHRVAAALHDRMGIVPADAAEPGVWAFLACVAVPDLVCWRFPRRTPERLEGGQRNALRRLWWRAHLLGDDLMTQLNEDELVQIMERPESALGNPRIARAIGAAHILVCNELHVEGRMRLLRDAAKRVLRYSALVTLDALDDESLSRTARRLLMESAVALGETDAEVPPAGELQLLTSDGGSADWSDAQAAAPHQRLPGHGADLEVEVGESTTGLDHADSGPAADEPLGAVPLGRVRLAVVEAIRDGSDRLRDLPGAAAAQLGLEANGLPETAERLLLLLARNAEDRGWIEIDGATGELRFRAAPSGGAVYDGQLMRHSPAQVAATLLEVSPGNLDDATVADVVVESLGYTPPAGPTARALIDQIHGMVAGREGAGQS
jgi:hypothetical protein